MVSGSRWLRVWALVNGVVVVGLVVSALGGDNGVVERERRREELAKVRALNDEISAKNQALKREIDALAADDVFLEQVVREETGWVRPDEVIYVFRPTASDAPTPREATPAAEPTPPTRGR
jgi:cell division protein FtsB